MRKIANYSKIFLLITLYSTVYSQSIKEYKKDEFTGRTVLKTTWEPLSVSLKFTSYFRIIEINQDIFLNVRMMIGTSVFSIDDGDILFLKLNNGEIIELKNLKFAVTCIGCGSIGISGSNAMGIEVNYPITEDQVWSIIENDPIKIRIYTSDGYVENDLSPKNSRKIVNSFRLL